MKNKLASIITLALVVAIIALILPVLKWLFGLFVLAVLIVFVYTLFESKKVKKEIEGNPNAHFNSDKIIEAQYEEKEVVEVND